MEAKRSAFILEKGFAFLNGPANERHPRIVRLVCADHRADHKADHRANHRVRERLKPGKVILALSSRANRGMPNQRLRNQKRIPVDRGRGTAKWLRDCWRLARAELAKSNWRIKLACKARACCLADTRRLQRESSLIIKRIEIKNRIQTRINGAFARKGCWRHAGGNQLVIN